MAATNGVSPFNAPIAIQHLRELRESANANDQTDDKHRRELIEEARALARSLENDGEILARTQWGVSLRLSLTFCTTLIL